MEGKMRILFVDDEPRILQGVKRMLRGMRNEWEMVFAESGREALALMENEAFQVIVSDMRMPGMTGAELLDHVMKTSPQTVRIVLSGHSDREMILKSVNTAHQYLAKPCEAEVLKSTIIRSCSLRALVADPDMKRIISKMDSIPSLPGLYTEMMEELQSPESSLKNVGKIIEKDMGMSAKILKLVNSAFFGIPTQVSSPSHAVSLLGLEVVKSLILTAHVFSQFDSASTGQISLDAMWKHSERVGHLSKRIYEKVNNDKISVGYALMAGLLHDIGKLIFIVNFPDRYKKVLGVTEEQGLILSEKEKEEFGVSHGEIGAYLLNLWGLPDPVIEAIAYHHTPGRVPVTSLSPLLTVHVANCLDYESMAIKGIGKCQSLDLDFIKKAGLSAFLPDWRKMIDDLIPEGDE